MAPQDRTGVKRNMEDPEVIEVFDDSSDGEKGNPKRLKTSARAPETTSTRAQAGTTTSTMSMSDEEGIEDEFAMDVDEYDESDEIYPSPGPSVAAVPLKGRKRFLADLEELKNPVVIKIGSHGYALKNVKAGEDEGSVEFEVLNPFGNHVASANLLVSDTSEYPEHHTFYAFSTGSDIPHHISPILEDVSSGTSRSIRKTFEDLLVSIYKASREEEDEDEDDDDEYEAYDQEDMVNTVNKAVPPTVLTMNLQHDFLEIVACDYRPGIVKFGIDDFSLSVSIPVIKLAGDIPARALMAWDRRLLSRAQHLTLLISGLRGTYPVLNAEGALTKDAVSRGTALQFKVGLTRKYKPSKEHALEAKRTFGLVEEDPDEVAWSAHDEPVVVDGGLGDNEPWDEDEDEDEGGLDSFSLSSSLESLLDHSLLRVIQTRLKFRLGWAGAELLVSESEKLQETADDVIAHDRKAFTEADQTERNLTSSYNLPPDPLRGHQKSDEDLNIPLIAFCYLIRRLTLCTRYCLVCHSKLNTDFEVLKPYVCDSKLCTYQFYAFNRGPSLEYEIRSNPATVDLLVSMAYTAAADQCLEDPLPVGMGIQVSPPDPVRCVAPVYRTAHGQVTLNPIARVMPIPGPDGLCDFDELGLLEKRAAIAELIHHLPPVREMKRHLERKVKAGKAKPTLSSMDPSIPAAAWLILRWCVASCTAHLEELRSDEDLIRNIDGVWRQFRFTIGAPDAEAKFKEAVKRAQSEDRNAVTYPSLYAFHGSAMKNWHSIIRHGLWFRTIANGRAFGNGVYFAKDGSTSMGGYAQVAEIVNQPSKFVSSNPHYVVQDTNWIMCRYLLVKTATEPLIDHLEPKAPDLSHIPLVKLDPKHPLTLSGSAGGPKNIQFPEPSYKLDKLLTARQSEFLEEHFDEDDQAIFNTLDTPANSQQREVIVIEDSPSPPPAPIEDDWEHDAEWVEATVGHLMPPPAESSNAATMALQRELRAMIQEQDSAKSLKSLGWYMPPDFIGDNLFQWIVELHSFEETLPVAQDMKREGVNSVVFEIRFPPTFPHAPPFFRIIKPRMLPFIQGGGGHVTGGGSMCMDLLTSDGWLPSYSISSVLLQIRLAISNLEPRPARLSSGWDQPYGIQESLEGYKRAAKTHGWTLPDGIDRLVR